MPHDEFDDLSSSREAETKLDRRGALACMGWAGTGALFALSGGIASSVTLDRALAATTSPAANFSFVQISDTHIGFSKPANPDPLATLRETLGKIAALPQRPEFIIHTGDITHLATPEQFDTAQSMLMDSGMPIFFVPGEHDIKDGTDPRPYLDRFGKDSKGQGWYSFDAGGAHFIGLVNVLQLGDHGLGTLGAGQLQWLKDDLAGLPASTPIVLMSHFPLWALYPEWGWGTQDAAEAMKLLSRFGSVTSLNGHIHQIQQKVEGNVRFHSARSTAFPQPAPGQGPGPGPLLLPAEQLRRALGLTSVTLASGSDPIAVTDTVLG